jgi:chemotaxis protein methyltransferase CheR
VKILVSITEKEFEKLSIYIKDNFGIKLGKGKITLVNGRLGNSIEKMGFKNFSDYYNYVILDASGVAVYELLNRITTNHTFFMREPQHFKFFNDVILPGLKATIKDKDLRIWSAGCSTGEEPYTLAMIVDEYFGKEKVWWNTKILATDISNRALEVAYEGIYSSDKISSLSNNWKSNYFKKINEEQYAISEKIKNEVIYRKFNLMDKVFPFKKKFHVIFCRNVMIYFDEDTKRRLVQKFYDNLEEGGYLFIGHSESLGRDNTKFNYIQPALYRKG